MKKTIIIIIVVIALATTAIICNIDFKKEDKKETKVSDATKFKEEYEKLNDEINPNNQKKYPKMNIPSDNVIKYVDVNEVLDILDSKTAVIYFGYPECPWCRNAVPVLLNAAVGMGLSRINYYNANQIKNVKEVDKDGNIIETQKAKDGYRELLEALDSILEEYTLTDANGKTVHTGEKRIYVPLVVFVKDGEIVAYHEATVDSQEDPYILLDDKQTEELYNIYVDNIGKITNSTCDDKC